ncbi:transcription repressor NadR [Halobacillus seohaensis]|uniref:Transcription repressor NadR n=1 Tax=Halobacillus seohaensis TaxID=447421 RepID=A0ABW2EPY8_9BACI
MSDSKIKANERREQILFHLKRSNEPLKGSSLAEQMQVTRQVIVGDVSLLKASGEPIIATSQGYVYITDSTDHLPYKQSIVCRHEAEQTEEELNILVDHGVHVLDVIVEHPVYGDLKARLGVSNRRDVKKFIERVKSSEATFLLELTGGIHTHTIAASQQEALHDAVEELAKKGILLDS